MRTTIAIDDDALDTARRYAAGRDVSLGRAVSDLIRQAVQGPIRTKRVHGLLIFDPPADSPPVTTEHVRRLQHETE